MTDEYSDEIERKIEEWGERAREINPGEHQNTEYWKGVRNAYHELAKELKRSVETEKPTSGFEQVRCPECGRETSVEYEISTDYAWAKIDCPYGHQTTAYGTEDVSSFLERIYYSVDTESDRDD